MTACALDSSFGSLHQVLGYFGVCIALVIWMGYAAERGPIQDATVE